MSIRHLWSCISDLSGEVIVRIGHPLREGQPSFLLGLACVALDALGCPLSLLLLHPRLSEIEVGG